MTNNSDSFSVDQLEKYNDIPALTPPPGEIPDFAAPNHSVRIYTILCSILLGIVYLFVFLRMYVKIWIKRSPGFDDRMTLDDPLVGGSFADMYSGVCSCNGVFTFKEPCNGFGSHGVLQVGLSTCFAFGVASKYPSPSETIPLMTVYQWSCMELASTNGMCRYRKYLLCSRSVSQKKNPDRYLTRTPQYGRYNSIILPPTMLCLKMSLLLLYFGVFGPDKVARYLIYIGMAICIVAYTALMFLDIFSNVTTVIAANKSLGVVNFTSDVYILCVPIAAISKLQLSLKKRIGVMFIFMAGIVYDVSCCDAICQYTLTIPQSVCDECRRPCIPDPSPSNRSRRHIPFGRHHPPHVRTHLVQRLQ